MRGHRVIPVIHYTKGQGILEGRDERSKGHLGHTGATQGLQQRTRVTLEAQGDTGLVTSSRIVVKWRHKMVILVIKPPLDLGLNDWKGHYGKLV